MKLSEAMMLGSVTCKMVPGDWNSCGLGCAGNAVGIPQSERKKGAGRSRLICDNWPWLRGYDGDGNFWNRRVWERFDFQVCEGKMTFEQLVDYVRSVEPECGECNQFKCVCDPTEVSEKVQKMDKVFNCVE